MITVEEKYLGRQLTRSYQGGAKVEYIIQGTDDDKAALTAMQEFVPLFWDNLPCLSCEVAQIASTIWEGTATYGRQNNQQQQQNENNFSFETGGGTQHITQSISTTAKYAPSGKTAPDYQGAIGVDHNSVNGVDITVPVYSWSDTYIFASSVVTSQFKQNLYQLTGKVNGGVWNGYNAGEVLFLGASGSKRGNRGDWEITYKYAASPNVTNKTVGAITGIAKKGWEYLWIRYDDDTDPAAKVLIKKPIAVYVEKVYEDGDFSVLFV